MQQTININRDFSHTPGGRRKTDGSHSAEKFRDEILEPALLGVLKKDGLLIIELDGTAGIASSFLEEAFGGLVRVHGYSYSVLRSKILFCEEENQLYANSATNHMREAALCNTKDQ